MPAYVSLPALRDYTGPGAKNPSHDARLEAAAEAASRAVDGYCGRRFYRDEAPSVRRVKARYRGRLVLAPTLELAEAPTSVVVDGLTWAPLLDYELDPLEQVGPTGEPWPVLALEAIGSWRFVPDSVVEVTGIFGWPAVPEAVRQATLIMAAQLWKMSEAPLGVAGFGEYGAMRVRANPVAAEMLQPYVHGGSLL